MPAAAPRLLSECQRAAGRPSVRPPLWGGPRLLLGRERRAVAGAAQRVVLAPLVVYVQLVALAMQAQLAVPLARVALVLRGPLLPAEAALAVHPGLFGLTQAVDALVRVPVGLLRGVLEVLHQPLLRRGPPEH